MYVVQYQDDRQMVTYQLNSNEFLRITTNITYVIKGFCVSISVCPNQLGGLQQKRFHRLDYFIKKQILFITVLIMAVPLKNILWLCLQPLTGCLNHELKALQAFQIAYNSLFIIYCTCVVLFRCFVTYVQIYIFKKIFIVI